MSSIKPILFSTAMVRALQAGRKTQTRRLVKPQPPKNARLDYSPQHGVAFDYATGQYPMPDEKVSYKPPYQPGDILYVRETWGDYREETLDGEDGYFYLYRADYPDGAKSIELPPEQKTDYAEAWDLPKWHPSIHMPKEAARIFLRVTDVRVERLQESFFCYGAIIRILAAEGIDIGDQCRECIETYGNPCCIDDESECGVLDDVRDDFAKLWDSTLKHMDYIRYGWRANPWVWVYCFERCEKPEELL